MCHKIKSISTSANMNALKNKLKTIFKHDDSLIDMINSGNVSKVDLLYYVSDKYGYYRVKKLLK